MDEKEFASSLENLSSNSKFSDLMRKLLNYTKNVSLDNNLNDVLNGILKKVHDAEVFLSQGICNVNFSEIALLIQGCGILYSKKVDLLWDEVINYQKHIIFIKPGNSALEETQLIEKNQKKRKRKAVYEKQENEKNIEYILEIPDYLNINYDVNNLYSEWSKFKTFNLYEKNIKIINYDQKHIFQPSDYIYNIDSHEYMCRYDQLHSISVIEAILSNNIHQICKNSLIENNIIKDSIIDSFLDHSINFCKNSDHSSNENDEGISINELYIVKHLIHLAKRPSCSQDSAFYEEDDEDSENEESQSTNCDNEIELSNENLQENKICEADEEESDNDDSNQREQQNESELNKAEQSKEDTSVTDTTVKIKFKKITNVPEKKKENNLNNQCKIKKFSKKTLDRLCMGISVNNVKFEDFYSKQYKILYNKGPHSLHVNIIDDIRINDSIEETNVNTCYENNNSEELHKNSKINCFGNNNENEINYLFSNNDNDDNYDLGYFTENKEYQLDTSFRDDTKKSSQEALSNWRSFITSKINNLETKGDFDIREYSSELMKKSKKKKLFKKVVKGKSTSEICRYFSALLHLGNSQNIKISGISHGKISNDTLSFKLINNKNHHEKLLNYVAPSEETLYHRLETVMKMKCKSESIKPVKKKCKYSEES